MRLIPEESTQPFLLIPDEKPLDQGRLRMGELGMSQSTVFSRLKKAERSLDGWKEKCDNPERFFYPIMVLEYGRTFDLVEKLRSAALEQDPVRYIKERPHHWMAFKHLLPADFVAALSAAETDRELYAAASEWRMP